MGHHILAIDAGGTAVKAAIFDTHGVERSVAGEALKPLSPASGFVERDAEAMWASVCRSVRGALAEAGLAARDIAAIGLTGSGNGLFLLDREGRAVRNGILSSDQRAAGVVRRWKEAGLDPGHVALTQQHLWAGKPLPLLRWLEEHEPESVARAAHVLMGKDVLRFRMTGRPALEITDASTASLIDHAQRRWSPSVLDHLGLAHRRELFGEVIETLSLPEGLTGGAADALGLMPGTPVAAGSADGHAMLLASGIVDDTLLNVIAGTWALNQLTTAIPTTDGSVLACTLGPRPGGYILIEGAATSASTFEWFVETVVAPARASGERGSLYDWCNAEIRSARDADPPVFFLPFINGLMDTPEARGCFIGLSSWHGLPHMIRAVFEGVAFEHRAQIERLLLGRPAPLAARFTGGAARSRPWLEIFAAVLDLPIEIGTARELGALGAAILASVAAGLHGSLEDAVAAMTRVGLRIAPDPGRVTLMGRRYRAYQSLTAALDPVWRGLAEP